MKKLTKRQKEIYDFLLSYSSDYGYSPSLEEIKEELGISAVSTVFEHLNNLEKKGYISREKGQARGIELKNLNLSQNYAIPLLGQIACGEPLEALEESGDYISMIQDSRFNPNELYALRAKGDSMIEDGIFSGDYLIIKKQSSAENGDTVVAIIDDNEATLKRFYKEKTKIKLEPANSNYQAIYPKAIEIRGIVLKVIRDLV